MSELYMMVTITNRQLTRKFVECYKENGAQVGSVTVGMGTAANEILDYFGLDGMEKCTSCGAKNQVIKGRLSNCEYCGQRLNS